MNAYAVYTLYSEHTHTNYFYTHECSYGYTTTHSRAHTHTRACTHMRAHTHHAQIHHSATHTYICSHIHSHIRTPSLTQIHTHTHSQAYTHIHNNRIIVLSFGYRYKTKLKHQEKVTTQLEQDHATTLVRYLLHNNTTELSLYGMYVWKFQYIGIYSASTRFIPIKIGFMDG